MEFEIEVVEYYPHPNKKNKGTMHIYIPHLDMDLRGIIVSKNKKGYYFHMPSRFAIDEATGKTIQYPVINFIGNGKNKALMTAVRKEGTKFLNDR